MRDWYKLAKLMLRAVLLNLRLESLRQNAGEGADRVLDIDLSRFLCHADLC